jgi:hypothetical protein
MAQLHRPERRPQVLADDALVVLAAALSGSALLDPVVAEVPEPLLGRRRVTDAPLDLLDLDLVPAQLRLRSLVVVEDGALPLAVLVEPANAPLAGVLDGLGHDLCSFLRASRPVSCTPSAIPCRNALGRRSRGPKLAPERKTRGGLVTLTPRFHSVARAGFEPATFGL